MNHFSPARWPWERPEAARAPAKAGRGPRPPPSRPPGSGSGGGILGGCGVMMPMKGGGVGGSAPARSKERRHCCHAHVQSDATCCS